MVGGTQKLDSKLINLSHKRFFVDPTEKRIVDGEITPKSECYLGWESGVGGKGSFQKAVKR